MLILFGILLSISNGQVDIFKSIFSIFIDIFIYFLNEINITKIFSWSKL